MILLKKQQKKKQLFFSQEFVPVKLGCCGVPLCEYHISFSFHLCQVSSCSQNLCCQTRGRRSTFIRCGRKNAAPRASRGLLMRTCSEASLRQIASSSDLLPAVSMVKPFHSHQPSNPPCLAALEHSLLRFLESGSGLLGLKKTAGPPIFGYVQLKPYICKQTRDTVCAQQIMCANVP